MKSSNDTRTSHSPDFEAIALLAEGRLGWWQRRRLLRHLANCDSCRQVWITLSASDGREPVVEAGRNPGRWSGWPPLVAAAAVVVLALVVLLIIEPSDQPRQWLAAAPDEVVSERWRAADAPAYRHPTDPLPAVILMPRYSILADARPSLHWHPAAGLMAERAEILVIDEHESLVATWEVASQTGQTQWPDDQPGLTAEREYAWKLTVWTPGGPRTTPFIPFRVSPVEPTSRDPSPARQQLADLIKSGRFDRAWLLLREAPMLLPADQHEELLERLQARLHLDEIERVMLEDR